MTDKGANRTATATPGLLKNTSLIIRYLGVHLGVQDEEAVKPCPLSQVFKPIPAYKYQKSIIMYVRTGFQKLFF